MSVENIFLVIPRELFESIVQWLSEHDFRKLRCVDHQLSVENRNYFFTCVMNIDISGICNQYWSKDL